MADTLRRWPVVPVDPAVIDRIRQLMSSAGEDGKPLTQQQLVERARARGGTIGKATLNRVLGGKVEPKYDTLHAIALGLDVSLVRCLSEYQPAWRQFLAEREAGV
jgi:transcriptional regulator with XRE-family HTH domain